MSRHAYTDSDTFRLYAEAMARVTASDRLSKYASIILCDDWREGDDHLRWVIDASEDEIVKWASAIAMEQ